MINDFFTVYLKTRKTCNVTLVNETKFLQVVEFWFQFFDYVSDFSVHKNKDINLLKNKLISKSILYSLDVLEEKSSIRVSTENKIKQRFIGGFSFGKTGYLPAGVSSRITDKIHFKLLLNKIGSIKSITNEDFKGDFFEECTKRFDAKVVEVLQLILPDHFFSIGLSSNYSLPYILKGSPLCFFDFHYNYLKLLIQPRKVKIIGVQHGGVYGEWENNPYEKFEKNISDLYYGWGFFNQNIIQNRFKKNPKQIGIKEGVFWFGRDEGYVSKDVDFGNVLGDHNQVVSHIGFFNDFFKEYDFKFLPHPRISPLIYSEVIDKSRYIITSNSTLHVKNAKLVVFDCISQTLMYYCLYNKIPFVIVLDDWPISELSSSASEYYDMLFRNGLLLYKNDVAIAQKLEVLSEKLNEDESVFLTNQFVTYINEKFFSHKTINLI